MAQNSLDYYPQQRYSNRNFGISYVSGYNPAVDERMLGLMEREYSKAFSTNQALAEESARQGELFSYDPEGKSQRTDEFLNTTKKIKEQYNNDLALAAPELARAVAKERQNDWYQKNKLYTEEYQRRQKLVDQFGPNLLFTNELPQGNLHNVKQEDINFEYVNRQHLFDIYKQQFGALADKVTSLGIKTDPTDPRFLVEAKRKGLTDTEIQTLIDTEGSPLVDQLIQNMGIEDSPTTRAMLSDEFGQWAQSNLVASTIEDRMLDPYKLEDYKNGLKGADPGYKPPPKLNPTGELPTVAKGATPAATAANVVTKVLADPNAPEGIYMEDQIRKSENDDLLKTWNTLTHTFEWTKLPEGITQDQAVELRSSLIQKLSGKGNNIAIQSVLDSLVETGIVEKKAQVQQSAHSTGMTGSLATKTSYIYNDKSYSPDQMVGLFSDMINSYKDLNKNISKGNLEKLGDLYDPTAVTTKLYNPLDPAVGAEVQGAIQSNIVSTNTFDELRNMGFTAYKKDQTKALNDNKSKDMLKGWVDLGVDAKKSYNVSVVPGSLTGPARARIVSPEGDLMEIPIQREFSKGTIVPLLEQTTSGNMVDLLAGMFDTPDLVNSDIDYLAGAMFRSNTDRAIPISKLFGGSAADLNLGNLEKESTNLYSWTIPGFKKSPETTAYGSTPSDVLNGISTIVGPQIGSKFTKIDEYLETIANKYATNTKYSESASALSAQYQ